MNIALFGGSFDPFHNGHIHAIKTSCDTISINKLIMIPNYQSPHKSSPCLDTQTRYTLIKNCLPTIKSICFSNTNITIDICTYEQEEKSFTIDTLKRLKKDYPHDTFYFILGSDAFFSLHTWKEYQEITTYCTLIITQREKRDLSSYTEYAQTIANLKNNQWIVCSNKIKTISSKNIQKNPNRVNKDTPGILHLQLKALLENKIKQPLIIGITGRVGSGKSYALNIISRQLNAKSIELDTIGHECLEKTKPLLIKQFGTTILQNNTIDRERLGDIVFSDKVKLDTLNKIIHPEIKTKTLQEIDTSHPTIMCGALLHEILLAQHCHIIINIDAHASQIKQRIGSKFRIAKFQLSKKAFKQKATHTLTNTFSHTFDIICKNICKEIT